MADDRKRRGMLIKNTGDRRVQLTMATRLIHLDPGEERFITPEEVRDPLLREGLQVRTISIVRPATEEEEAALQERLEEGTE